MQNVFPREECSPVFVLGTVCSGGGETAGCGSTVKMLNLQGCLFLGQAETGAYTLGATSELRANQNWEVCQDQSAEKCLHSKACLTFLISS